MSHDPSDIIIIRGFGIQDTFLMFKTVVLLSVFMEAVKHFFQDYWMGQKNNFLIEIFCNVINVFTVTFD